MTSVARHRTEPIRKERMLHVMDRKTNFIMSEKLLYISCVKKPKAENTIAMNTIIANKTLMTPTIDIGHVFDRIVVELVLDVVKNAIGGGGNHQILKF